MTWVEDEHGFYRAWLEKQVNGPAPFALSVLVAIAFVRVVTHPRFPNAPTPREEAIAEIEGLISAPSCRLVSPGAAHWELVRDLCRGAKWVGARVSASQHAAIAIEHGCTLVSRDSDFEVLQRHGLSFKLLEPGD